MGQGLVATSGRYDALLGALLRREGTHPPLADDATAVADFLDAARQHGVLPLLDQRFHDRSCSVSWPEEILRACRQATLAQTGFEIAHGAELDRVLEEFAGAALAPLLLKGTGLAYGLYSNPALRPRADTDLLVAPHMRDRACEALQVLGYRRVGGPAGRFVGYQLQAQRLDSHGIVHNIDLHWRLRDEQAFAWLLSFEELAAAAIPVPSINSRALRLGNPHSLLLALLHRASNNVSQGGGFGDRLIWLYDMHLLVEAMDPDELGAFRALVATKRVGAVAIEGLERCAVAFPSRRLAALIDVLAGSSQARSGAEFLTAGKLRRTWMELHSIPDFGARLAYVGARAFPAPDYMRERYPQLPDSSLTALYLRRGFAGLAGLFRGHNGG